MNKKPLYSAIVLMKGSSALNVVLREYSIEFILKIAAGTKCLTTKHFLQQKPYTFCKMQGGQKWRIIDMKSDG